jgi:hypothetical protein
MNAGPDGRPEELLLVVGHVAPPVLAGSPEQYAVMLAATSAVEVKTLGRYSLSRGRVRELIEYLTQQAELWDRQSEGVTPEPDFAAGGL